jgi:hypothetical protein
MKSMGIIVMIFAIISIFIPIIGTFLTIVCVFIVEFSSGPGITYGTEQ